MRRPISAFLAFCGIISAKPFTLEQALSAPFPSEMTAAPGGGAVAWLLNERGARNVWYAAAPDFKGVRLTSWADDDGQDIGQLHFTADGKSLIFVRGGDLEFLGRADPNPASNPAGVEQDIWIVSPTEKARRIAQGHSPAIDPKGGRIAFLRAGQIWTASLDGTAQPAQLVHARSGASADELAWSPDGSKLAFTSQRGNHSFIAVYDFGGKSVTYMDPSVDRDGNATWSRDSSHVAFIRVMQTSRVGRGGPNRSSSAPWSIRVANAADGTGRQVWQADQGPGSVFHADVSEHQLFWADGGRIVFPWEKDGWEHLYTVSAEGGTATALTPGAFEVEHVSFTDDGKEAVFSSNQGDIDRRHIWRVALSGGTPRAVTSGQGLEWSPVNVANGVAYLHSDAKQPARAAVRAGSAEHDLAPDSIPAEFPVSSLVIPEQVIYSSPDGMSIHGQLFLPPDLKPGEKRPAMVFMHGGSRRQMLLGWHYMDYYNNAYAMNQYLANQGYVVLSINYRSGIGYGLNFREALNYGVAGASEFNDVEGAGLYLRNRPDVDSARIGLWGGSYGGYLTAMGLARASDLFKAGVDFHGVHDWNALRGFAAAPAGTLAAEAEREDAAHLAFESSPMASVKTWRSPVLLIHGDDDRNVAFSETVTLVGALRAQGVYFEQLILPDEIHGFLRHQSWLRAYKASADFLHRKL
ncbi:MAG TPA: prolyl oligopeptidase family serine peptidase [Bryobacteraceae bacterium]|nr:prolyl oligopeptidase family serine peptidase [Bryobacteraceae bacterium]